MSRSSSAGVIFIASCKINCWRTDTSRRSRAEPPSFASPAGLIAMMAVGNEQRARFQRSDGGAENRIVRHPPDPVPHPVGVSDVHMRLFLVNRLFQRLDDGPVWIRIERKNRAEVAAAGFQEV